MKFNVKSFAMGALSGLMAYPAGEALGWKVLAGFAALGGAFVLGGLFASGGPGRIADGIRPPPRRGRLGRSG